MTDVTEAPTGPAGALKAAAGLFRSYEASHAAKPCVTALEMEERDRKVARNRDAAQMCEGALAQIEAMATAALEPKVRAEGPSPAEWFRAGFSYGQLAESYEHAGDELRERVFPGGPPPAGWEDAWAVARSALAKGAGHDR